MARQPLGVWLPRHAKVIHVASIQVLSKADIPKVPPAHKATRVRLSDPRRTEIHLRGESRQAIDWLSSCFARDRIRSIRQKTALQCYAAADAVSKDKSLGVGGWIVTATQYAWFCVSEARTLWPELQDTAQRYIACFETPCAVSACNGAHRTCSAKHWFFSLPAASENAPTAAGLDKLSSAAEPLGFLKTAAAWAARRHVQFMVTHIAGEKNTWADALSRNRLLARPSKAVCTSGIASLSALRAHKGASPCALQPPAGRTSLLRHSVQEVENTAPALQDGPASPCAAPQSLASP